MNFANSISISVQFTFNFKILINRDEYIRNIIIFLTQIRNCVIKIYLIHITLMTDSLLKYKDESRMVSYSMNGPSKFVSEISA